MNRAIRNNFHIKQSKHEQIKQTRKSLTPAHLRSIEQVGRTIRIQEEIQQIHL